MNGPLKSSIVILPNSDESSTAPPDMDQAMDGKFIVIAGPTILALIYGHIDRYEYHADLVKRYCDMNDIASGWVKKPDVYRIFDKAYRILGGGWLEKPAHVRRLKFYGTSTAYGPFTEGDIRRVFDGQAAFRDYGLVFID
ncbi:MAG: hypothetical protein JSW34_13605 [Candidatus Zixiibacteriota bacterium]|nr:MAG: hypothetical protein JSW34_13605 [candidate division Zixibacteria bacterium]